MYKLNYITIKRNPIILKYRAFLNYEIKINLLHYWYIKRSSGSSNDYHNFKVVTAINDILKCFNLNGI